MNAVNQSGLPLQIRRLRITSSEWEDALPANPNRRFLRVAMSSGGLTDAQSVKLALDSPGGHYCIAWALQPFEPRVSPTNAVFLRIPEDPAAPGVEQVAFVEIVEG